MSSLGTCIRNARVRANLSQQDFAARLGVSQGTVSFWERDIETPTLDNLVKLLAQYPDLLGDIRAYRSETIQQLRQIERALFNGQCACEGGVALYDYDPNAVTVRVLQEVMQRLEKQFELLPSRTPVSAEAPRLSPDERKRCFPECN